MSLKKYSDSQSVIIALQNIGSGHCEDIQKFLQWKIIKRVSRRIPDLVKRKLVIDTGIKKEMSTGAMTIVYGLSDKLPKTDKQVKQSKKKIKKKNNIRSKPERYQPEMY